MKIAAIVPALNEEQNVGNVLKVLLSSPILNEIILVDDGSIDNTAEVGRQVGAKVLTLLKKGGSGKGNAMREAVKNTDADIIAFFDADLVGLQTEHISQLVQPILKNEAAMCVGIRDRKKGLPQKIAKIDPLLAIGGERAMKRELFLALPERFIQGFAVETALNYYCKINKLSVSYPVLRGLDMIIKEKKWGLWKGLKSRIGMIWQIIKIRAELLIYKKEFKKQ